MSNIGMADFLDEQRRFHHQEYAAAHPFLYRLYVHLVETVLWLQGVPDPWEEGSMVKIGHYLEDNTWVEVVSPISEFLGQRLKGLITDPDGQVIFTDPELEYAEFVDCLTRKYLFVDPVICFSQANFRIEANILQLPGYKLILKPRLG